MVVARTVQKPTGCGWQATINHINKSLCGPLPAPVPLARHFRRKRQIGNHRQLSVVRHAADIFAPCHFVRVGIGVRPRDMVVRTNLSAAQAAEKAVGLVRASVLVLERNLMVYLARRRGACTKANAPKFANPASDA